MGNWDSHRPWVRTGANSQVFHKPFAPSAIEGRRRTKDQLMRIDSTYPEAELSFTDKVGRATQVQTLEEQKHQH